MYSEALKRAQKKYQLTHDVLSVRLPAGTLEKIENAGYKRQEFIREAIKEKLERETGKNGKL